MNFSRNRRRLVQASSSAAVLGALSFIPRRTLARSNELRVVVGGGEYGRANIEALVKPFQAETGINVTSVTDDSSLAQVELMVNTKNVTVDVVEQSAGAVQVGLQKGLLEKIDYSLYKKSELDGMPDFARLPVAVANVGYAFNMVWNTDKFPRNKQRPASWAEFWDVKKFPGVRALQAGAIGTLGPWEEALMADGVPLDKIYPMDLDRVFASLDRIKPHIRKWWTTGSEGQQLMRDKAVDICSSYDGRAQQLIDQGAPFEINRAQAKMTWNYWAIPKGSPNAENAQKFIEFASRPAPQAARTQLIAYSPGNRNALALLPDKVARKLASHPDYAGNTVVINASWYGQRGSDGKTNVDRLRERWNDWILR